MKRINRYVLTVFSTAAFLLSCSEDVNINLESQGDPIQFEFTANDNIDVITRNDNGMPSVATTRGTVITAFASTKSIKLYAYDHSGAFASSNDPGTYGFNAAYEGGDASTLNITESTKYWPYDQTSSGNRKLSFFAFYPSDCGTYASTSGYPTHEYTVSTTVANQTDLLVAKAVNQTVANRNGAGKLPITFNHALSAVIFSIGANFGAKNGSVTITIKNVYNHGLYNYGTGTWTPKPETPTTTNYSVTLSGITASATDVSTLSGNDEKAGKVLFLLPQTIPNNATLEISYTDGGNVTHTFSKQLKTISSITTWLPGHTYHYTISAASVGAMSATYPAWSGLALNQSPVQRYETSDHFGLFAVDPTTGTIVLNNIDCTGSNSGALTRPSSYFYSANYQYFLMYPRQNSVSIPAGNVEAALAESDPVLSANAFFDGVIEDWSVSPTQNSLALLRQQDLQIAKGTTSFTMAHKMGLVKITPTAKSVTKKVTWTFTAPQTAHTTYQEQTSGTTGSVTASTSFNATTSSRLCNSSGYWTIVKATGASTSDGITLGSVTTVADDWSQTVSGIGYGKYKNYNVQSSRTFEQFEANFPYNSSKTYYQITLPWHGAYKLEVYGASGNTGYGLAGKGGYTYGTYTINKTGDSKVLYVCVGGAGTYTSGVYSYDASRAGYNGGGYGQEGGGGATHIAQTLVGSGVLSAYSSSQSSVLVVAGGAGNGDLGVGGHGGGGNNNGGDGVRTTPQGAPSYGSNASGNGKGGTQSAGGAGFASNSGGLKGDGSFGQGGSMNNSGDSASGGGGGWYGGGSSTVAGNGPGGGGSGHINTSKITNGGGTTGGGTQGAHGSAKITMGL